MTRSFRALPIVVLFVNLLGVACTPPAYSHEEGYAQRIGFVHMGRVYAAYAKTQAAEEQIRNTVEMLNRSREELQHRAQEMSIEIKRLVSLSEDPSQPEDIQTRSDRAAQSKLKDLQKLGEEYRRLVQSQNAELDALRAERAAEGFGRIRETVGQMARERGIDVVLDSGQPNRLKMEWVLILNQGLDLTDDVIEALNRAAATDPTK